MKKFSLSLAAVALVAFTAGPANAQCTFNSLAKAKKIVSDVVRSFAECPSTQHPSANTLSQSNTPGCEPVVPKDEGTGVSTYEFEGKGGCKIKSIGKIEKDCADLEAEDGTPLNLPPGPCFNVQLKGKCKAIVQGDGITPINEQDDDGWSLATLSRATLNDPVAGDMTIIDFPVTFAFDPPKKGKIKMKGTSAEALTNLGLGAGAALPTCTQIEIVRITVKDAAGRPFARLGIGGADKKNEAGISGQ